jgi:hypothetical protein
MQALPGELVQGRPPALQLKNPEISLDLGCKLLSDAIAHFNGGSATNPTQNALAKGVAAYAVGIPVVESQGLDNADAKTYLAMFRGVWAQLWPGRDCPVGPGEVLVTPDGQGTTTTPGHGAAEEGGQTTTAPGQGAIPDALCDALLAAGKSNQVIRLNPNATLQRRILRDGFVPTSNEFDVVFGGKKKIAQRADDPKTGAMRVYYCEAPNFENVNFVE